MLDAHQLYPRGGVGLGVACRGDLAVTEETLGVAHAAHLQAFAQLRFEPFADDELGAAAADVCHQAAAGTARDGVRHAEIDQARFFAPGVDLDLMRSEERRVGKECDSTCGSGWWRYHQKKKKK